MAGPVEVGHGAKRPELAPLGAPLEAATCALLLLDIDDMLEICRTPPALVAIVELRIAVIQGVISIADVNVDHVRVVRPR